MESPPLGVCCWLSRFPSRAALAIDESGDAPRRGAPREASFWISPSNRLRRAHRGDHILVEAELGQDLVRVLAQERRAHDLARALRELDRIADGQILAARRMEIGRASCRER